MKIRIDKQTILWVILIAPFLRPNGIGEINSYIGMAYYFAMLISLALLFLLYITKKKSDVAFILLLGIVVIWIFMVTIFNGGEVVGFGRIIVAIFGIALCTEVMISKPEKYFLALLINLEVIIYLNFIFLLCYPEGMYVSQSGTANWNNWLLGYDNHWFIVFFVAYYIAVMHMQFSGKRARSLALIMIIHISTFITMSGVLIVGVLVMDVLFLSQIYKRKFFDFKLVCLIGIFSFVLLLFFYNSQIVNFIVYVFLQKDTSLTARSSIWNITLEYIADHPFVGYGKLATEFRQSMYHNVHGVNAHNMWLEMLFEGGIVSFGCFIGLICIVGKKLKACKQYLFTKIWLVAFLACFVTLNVDSAFELRGTMFFWLLSIGYHINCLSNNNNYLIPVEKQGRKRSD